jgi:hypothetical protein
MLNKIIKKFIWNSVIQPYRHHLLRFLSSKPNKNFQNLTSKYLILGDKRAQIFFGYHDKTPFSLDNNRVLSMRAEVNGRDPHSECAPIELGIFELDDEMKPSQFKPLATTTTWCWQQGCMLQWDPLVAQNQFYFNDIVNLRYGSKLYSISEQKIIRELPFPIYAISPNGEQALTLNFARLGRLRPGYGYGLLPDNTSHDPAPAGDGLFLADLESGECKLIVDLATIANSVESEETSQHYINHPSFSPDGTSIIFYHIWTLPGVNQRKIHLIHYDVATTAIQTLEESRVPSHYAWQDDAHLLVTTRDYHMKWHFTTYHVKTARRLDLDLAFQEDGHPMFHPTNNILIVSDSYPDKRRDQHLYVADISSGDIREVGAWYSPFGFRGQPRCDLHPRWDRRGEALIIDTPYSGRRQMVIILVNSAIRNRDTI